MGARSSWISSPGFHRRLHVVVTFMALLEMARLGAIVIAPSNFGQIWIYPVLEGRVVLPEVGSAEAPGAVPPPAEDVDGNA